MGVEVGVDFGGAGEGGEAVDWLGCVIVVGIAVTRSGKVVAGGISFGRFGELFGGFVQMSTEVADGSCAGIRPDAATSSDVFEDVDTLVCESIELSVLYTVMLKC